MRFIAISDTHGYHSDLILPEGDIIIHAGDITKDGTEKEVNDFLSWFSSLPYQYKIFISGNHDHFLDSADPDFVNKIIPENITYLNDSGVTINNIKIWGSPVQPCYYNMAFNRERGREIREHWELIPDDIDILITHGPAYGCLDENCEKENVGCEDLREKLSVISPKYFIFGHIHESSGIIQKDGTQFINACILDREYTLQNRPAEFSYP